MNLMDLDDEALLARLRSLVSKEREDTAEIVEHLAEVDRRDLAPQKAFPSLFMYCVQELGYTEAAAYYRIRAARTVKLFPQVLDSLKTGELSLETIVRLHPHLDKPNAAELLQWAKNKSKRDIETRLAELAPLQDKPDFVRIIATHHEPREHLQTPSSSPVDQPMANEKPQPGLIELMSAPETTRRVQISFTADEEIWLLLRRAQEILRHKYPAGRFEDLFRDALIALLDKRDPDRRLLGKLPKGVAVARKAIASQQCLPPETGDQGTLEFIF